MWRLIALLLCGWALLLGGCAIAPPQSYDSARLAEHLPVAVILDQVPFFPQERLQCGPAALATALVYQGVETSPERLEPYLFIPGRGGTLQLELKAAPRRYGLIAPSLEGGLEPLLATLAAGYPVVVLQNLALDWLPQWHYAVVVGYDLQQRVLFLHSGTTPHYRIAIDTFLHTWRRADNWAVVPSRPERPPPTVSPVTLLSEASALEQLGRHKGAIALYRRLQERLPEEPLLLFGLANSHYALGQQAAALEHYLQLTRRHPGFVWGWNNLAFVLATLGCRDGALRAIDCAVALAPGEATLQASREELSVRLASESSASCPSLPPCRQE